jgi:hypothetical protein
VKEPGYFRTTIWHQGDIIDDKSAIQALIKSSCGYISSASSQPEFVVIISQDCDILHERIEDEPYIDFLTGCFAIEKDGNLFHGKNPRKLQIEHNRGIICFVIHDVLRTKKDKFAEIDPQHSSMTLVKKDIRLIINWIAKRYARAAFPDEFNCRLSKSRQQIDKAQKNPLMDKVSLIFVDITDEELKSDQDYNVTMIIGVSHGSGQEIILKVEYIFYDAFDISGIDAKIHVYDEYDITYEIINTYKRFDWDFRSLSGNPEAAAPASGIDTV